MQIGISYTKEFVDKINKLKQLPYANELADLDGIGNQVDIAHFSKQFFSKKGITTADVSVDANANVDDMSIISYEVESAKPLHRLNSYYLLYKYGKKLFGEETAFKMLKAQFTKDIYINDFYKFNSPYCFNFSAMDVMVQGLPFVKKIISRPPKSSIISFNGQLQQFVNYASNSVAGAVGLADYLIVYSYYVKKLLDEHKDVQDEFKWYIVKQELQSTIYTLNQPFRGGIQCVDEETEVLTPDGFKKYNEINVGDEIYTWKDGKLRIQKVQKVNISHYKGEMHRYKSRDIEQVVTPNHRVLYKKNNSTEYDVKYSSELINAKTPLTIPVSTLYYDKEEYPISDEMLQLITIVLTDGNIDIEEGKSGRVRIFKSPKRFGGSLIRELLDNLGLEYIIKENNCGFDCEGIVEVFTLNSSSSANIISLLNGTKKELPKWMFELSRRQARLVIDTWAKFDGHIAENEYGRMKLQCDNYNIADQLQHLCFLAGKGSRIASRIIGNNKTETIYVIPFDRVNKSLNEKEKFIYEGIIWCPTTEDGIVVYRKNGVIFISGNSPFTNVSVYDDIFLDKLCSEYFFVDGSKPDKELIKKLQILYLDIMNEILSETPCTFPVTTACFAVDDERNILDKEFMKLICEKNQQFGFINIYAGKTSTLSSCCRLRSDAGKEYFNQFGAGGTKIGSLGVVTLNIPRIAIRNKDNIDNFFKEIAELTELAAKINHVKRHIIQKRIDNGNLPLYTFGFMDIKKQYSTCGGTGINEAVKFLGYDILTKEDIVEKLLITINNKNDEMEKLFGTPHNFEQVPAENSAIKLAQADILLGYQNEYEFYSNQFIPLITEADLLDRIYLQGKFDNYMTGGAICHLNVEQRIENVQNMIDLFTYAIKKGVIYSAINYNLQRCEKGHMTVGKNEKCYCGAKITDNFTRVVGFLVNTKNFHKVRREKDYPNRVFYKRIEV